MILVASMVPVRLEVLEGWGEPPDRMIEYHVQATGARDQADVAALAGEVAAAVGLVSLKGKLNEAGYADYEALVRALRRAAPWRLNDCRPLWFLDEFAALVEALRVIVYDPRRELEAICEMALFDGEWPYLYLVEMDQAAIAEFVAEAGNVGQ